MKRAINVRNITKLKRNVKAISPVIATLLMIAIAVVASLVVYAWINGYMNFQTEKAGQAIAIPSFAGVANEATPNIGDLVVYVQNVGQGTVEVSAVYVNGELVDDSALTFKPDNKRVISEGSTIEITIAGSNGKYDLTKRYDIKVTTTSGTSMTLTNAKPGTGGAPGTQLLTSLTCTVPASATVGTQFEVTGSLMSGSTGISGREITITCSAIGQTAVVNIATTGATGAYSAQITLNAAATWTVTATFAGDSTYAASTSSEQTIIINNVLSVARFSITGITTPTTAGTPRTVTVTAQDSSGNTVTGYRGTIHFTSTDSQATLPTDYTFTASDNGVHAFTNGVILKTAGTQSVTATDTVTSSITGSQTGISVTAGSAASLTVSGFPDPVTAGTSGNVTVTAKDAYGNTATGYSGTVRFTSNDGSATLPPNYSFTAGDNGVHTFTSVILKTVGERWITATDTVTSAITGSQVGITVNAPFDIDQKISGNGTGTVTLALPQTKYSNEVLYLTVSLSDTVSANVTDTLGLVWSQRAAKQANGIRIETWYAIKSVTTATNVTVTISGSMYTRAAVVLFSVSGADTSSPFDGSAVKTNGTSTSPSASTTTTNANNLLIGAVAVNNNPAVTTGNTYTLILTEVGPSNSRVASAEYKVVSSSGSQSAGFTLSSSQAWVMALDAIKKAP